MIRQHIVSAFDKDLSELNHLVSRLGGLAERQFDAAVQALETRNTENIDAIIAADKELDETCAGSSLILSRISRNRLVCNWSTSISLSHTSIASSASPVV